MQEKNKKIIDYFYLLKKYKRLSPSYIFVGAGMDEALTIAKLIDCELEGYFCGRCDSCLKIDKKSHPDILLIDTNSKIKIEDIQRARKFFNLKSFQSAQKVLIVKDAHLMGIDAGNSFLKTLEEPPKNSFIILLSSRTDLILPTILSRCRKIYFSSGVSVKNENNKDIQEILKGREIAFRDRKHLDLTIFGLICVFRDYIICKIYGNTKNLINKDNYEIILALKYSVLDAKNILINLLKIHKSCENINLNLAANLISLNLG